MRIRPASSEDVDTLMDLLGAQFAEHRIAVPEVHLRRAVRTLASDANRGAILLALDPHAVGVAVLTYTFTLEHGGAVAWLEELFVLPERRGRGAGTALLERALEVAQASGCRAVDLEVDFDHARAENLYRRAAFAPLPRRRWTKRLVAS
jgi:GNAT superfamily N-acetyltransferase